MPTFVLIQLSNSAVITRSMGKQAIHTLQQSPWIFQCVKCNKCIQNACFPPMSCQTLSFLLQRLCWPNIQALCFPELIGRWIGSSFTTDIFGRFFEARNMGEIRHVTASFTKLCETTRVSSSWIAKLTEHGGIWEVPPFQNPFYLQAPKTTTL